MKILFNLLFLFFILFIIIMFVIFVLLSEIKENDTVLKYVNFPKVIECKSEEDLFYLIPYIEENNINVEIRCKDKIFIYKGGKNE